MTDPDEPGLRAALAADLAACGVLTDPRWAHAFRAVPRHVFVPRFWAREPDGTYRLVNGADPAQRRRWLEAVYCDDALVTETDGSWSVSSSSQPSLMARMLQALEVTGVERVLEIGTGTGYNAALLCEGLGDGHVASVDIAEHLVTEAQTRLAGLGYRPTLAVADGAAGYPAAAPYDRIIATCSLPQVPAAWLNQVRDGGLILVNLYRPLGGGALARLRVHDGRASGHFMPFFGGFMPTRTYRRVQAAELLETHQAQHDRPGETRPAAITADALHEDAFAMLAALRLHAEQLWLLPDDAPEQYWLLNGDGSWACQTTDNDETPIVTQHGPRRLWDELETIHTEWTGLGRPARQRFGLTVTPDGEHRIWLDTPDGPSWTLPPA